MSEPPRPRPRRSVAGCMLWFVLGACCAVGCVVFGARVTYATVDSLLGGCISGFLSGCFTSPASPGSTQPAGAGPASAPSAGQSGYALGKSLGQFAANPPAPPTQSASGVFADAFAQVFTEAILLSWGRDRAAENARRLEWIAQGLREYQSLHGHPAASLDDLNISRDDLRDVFGMPIEYRVQGSPPCWEIRSAGSDRRFGDGDPWLAGP
jgi:hypothetical protein